MRDLVIIKGGGELGTGIALSLFRKGFKIIITELATPLVVVRKVSFSSAIYEGEFTVEGVVSKRVDNAQEALISIKDGKIPVLVDPKAEIIEKLKPEILVDAIMAKRNTGTQKQDAPLVIGIGPGFKAPKEVHFVIETYGDKLGNIISNAEAEKDTGVPIEIDGITFDRVLRTPISGFFNSTKDIGDLVNEGDIVAWINGHSIKSKIKGVIRGLLHDKTCIKKGTKVGEIDPRGIIEYCFIVSEKARAIGEGVSKVISIYKLKRNIQI